MSPPVSEVLCSYWGTLSYGNLVFGLDTLRRGDGAPKILTLPVPPEGPQNWVALIVSPVDAEAEATWRAAGALTDGPVRLIHSVVLVQNYWVHASALFRGFDRAVGGRTY